MAPPRNAPVLSTTDTVVAVPRSQMTQGAPKRATAATAPTSRSGPSWAGLSMRMLTPVLVPGPTISGVTPVTFFTAPRIACSSGGTTELMIAPSKSWVLMPYRRRMSIRSMAY